MGGCRSQQPIVYKDIGLQVWPRLMPSTAIVTASVVGGQYCPSGIFGYLQSRWRHDSVLTLHALCLLPEVLQANPHSTYLLAHIVFYSLLHIPNTTCRQHPRGWVNLPVRVPVTQYQYAILNLLQHKPLFDFVSKDTSKHAYHFLISVFQFSNSWLTPIPVCHLLGFYFSGQHL